jgi:hypothetical protein
MATKLLAVTVGMPKTAPIEVFCAKGRRSGLATAILRQAGFTNVVDLGGAPCTQQTLFAGGFAGTVTGDQRAAIVDFVRKQRISDDAAFHAFAKSIGVDADNAEPVVYQLAHDLSRQVRAHHVVLGVAVSLTALSVAWAVTRSRS